MAFCDWVLLFFIANYIPLYSYITFYLFIHDLMDFCVASHSLAIINNAPMNIPMLIRVFGNKEGKPRGGSDVWHYKENIIEP